MVIHELRSPLMGISGAMELFQMDSEGLTSAQNELVDILIEMVEEKFVFPFL